MPDLVVTREEAVKRLSNYIGKDLKTLADEFGVTIFKNGKLNKGWAGQTLEYCAGLTPNSRKAPNGEGWELKQVSLKKDTTGKVRVKETMAICMINSDDVLSEEFEDSHMYYKLRSIIICGRLFEGRDETHSELLSVGTFDLADPECLEQVKKDYELVRNTILNEGFHALTGKMGVLIQPRTKGPGHGSTSRAFYARTGFVKEILDI